MLVVRERSLPRSGYLAELSPESELWIELPRHVLGSAQKQECQRSRGAAFVECYIGRLSVCSVHMNAKEAAASCLHGSAAARKLCLSDGWRAPLFAVVAAFAAGVPFLVFR
jgi:hypothetical protein